MRKELADANTAFKAAIARVKAKQGSFGYMVGSWLTDADPAREVAGIERAYETWFGNARGTADSDTAAVNVLIAQAKYYIENANALIGYANDVTLRSAIDFVAKETAKDVLALPTLVPWQVWAGAGALIVILILIRR